MRDRMANMMLLMLVLLQAPLPFAQDQSSTFSRRLAKFSINVYTKLVAQNSNQNIIFSPFSIQTCAAMARMGAKGKTAAQLDRGLKLISNDESQIAESFHEVLAAYEKSSILHIANKIYIKAGYQLRDKFSSIIFKKFLSAVEPIDFMDVRAADQINSWVALRTNNLIKKIVDSSTLTASTRLLLINAIHFKGNWVHQFPKIHTRNEPFYGNTVKSIDVPMMNLEKRFRYATLDNLDATALELPYKDSDLSMLIVLPNSNTGLPQLETKLRITPLSQITEELDWRDVIVKLPKFKSEFEVELKNTFKQLGMSDMFSSNADFSRMITTSERLKVSKIIHKAVIEVNEKGTEAAASTASIIVGFSLPSMPREPKRFYADHPFNYYIINKQSIVLFAGKLINP
ncbi:serine protease inhibitor 42Dd-like isoform X2 [Drosophila sulfurigaster albostrigata]|uniref:serine protease inhibitor 42Dd-like isoform X2 n=1 Tax=Drosophila sulfurigaster albostrigata TaxID=89887 RepID=UPI002D21D224|nr:serine protease inhibitor 42Dd-like isoform X2 [Drosophila sulfurigaster albostrigata]